MTEPDLVAGPAPHRSHRTSVLGRALLLAVTGVSLYVLAPRIGEVFSAWDRLGQVHPVWILPAALCAIGSFACVWAVQAIALGSRDWFSIITTQLAGNAFNRITPGGGATGTALQANMLSDAGINGTRAGTALAAQSVLSTAALISLPLFSIPFVLAGTQIPASLLSTLWIGIPLSLVMVAIGIAAFVFDAPMRWLARAISTVRGLLRHETDDHRALRARLLASRDDILREISPRWKLAVGLSSLRWLFEYGVIIATLEGLSVQPNPAVTLLAVAAASLLGLLPFTPGGLGFVEAGLTGTLALAGISTGDALVTTLVYRLLTFWLPLPTGALAAIAFRRAHPRTHSDRARSRYESSTQVETHNAT